MPKKGKLTEDGAKIKTAKSKPIVKATRERVLVVNAENGKARFGWRAL